MASSEATLSGLIFPN